MSLEANGDVNPNDPDPQPDKSDKPSYEELEANLKNVEGQNKGLQRSNERLRTDLKTGIRTEALARQSQLTGESVTQLIEVLEKNALDDDSIAAFKAIKDKTAQVQSELSTETTVREEIADVLGKYGLDYDDDNPQSEVLRAHYDSGDFDKVRSTLKKIEDEHTSTDIETRAKAMSEEILREKGVTVDPGKGQGGPAPGGQEKILLGLEKGDITPAQAFAEALALDET